MKPMQANAPENRTRRIAVILGTGGSSRKLLDLVLPLLGSDRDIEMQGVFLEEAEVQHAAELPFVKELCRVTFSVREFTSDQFEESLNLRMRSARRALAVLARRAGVVHSFRSVRGPAVSLLRETAAASDIMVFEPPSMIAAAMTQAARMRRPQQRIVVAIADLETGSRALLAAVHLAGGRMERVSVILTAASAVDEAALERVFRELLPGRPARVRTISGSGAQSLVEAARAEAATMFVIGASEDMIEPGALRSLREHLRCPICLVRYWDDNGSPSN